MDVAKLSGAPGGVLAERWYRYRVVSAGRQWARSSRVALGLTAFLTVLPLYLCTIHTNVYAMSPDPIGVSGSAWSLAHRGTPVLPPGTAAWPAWLIPNYDGMVSNRPVGLIAIAAASYRVVPAAGIRDLTPASVAAALMTAGAVAIMAVVFSRVVSRRCALLAALLFGLGTTTWAVSSTALWPHGPDQLFLATSMAFAAVGSPLGVGFAMALATLTRPPLAIAAAVEGLWRTVARRDPRPALVIGGVCGLGLVVVLWYSQQFWRGGLDSQYVEAGSGFVGTFTDVSPHAWWKFLVNVLMTFVSPTRGLLLGSPFLLLLLPGIPAAWKVAPPWVRSASVAAVLIMAVQLKANRYGGGYLFWSYRYPLESLTMLAPLLLLSWKQWTSRSRRRRRYFTAFAVLSVTLQAFGAACYPSLALSAPPNSWLPGDEMWFAIAVVSLGGLATLAAFAWISAGSRPRRPSRVSPLVRVDS